MNPLLYLAGAGLVVVGLVGLLLPVLPGTLFIVLGIGAIALADGFARIGPWTLALIALIGLATWGVDALSGVVGARAAGASRWGIIGGFLASSPGFPSACPASSSVPPLGPPRSSTGKTRTCGRPRARAQACSSGSSWATS